jgi:tape measure domain-containing protein
MSEVFSLKGSVALDDRPFQSGLKRAQQSFQQMGRQLGTTAASGAQGLGALTREQAKLAQAAARTERALSQQAEKIKGAWSNLGAQLSAGVTLPLAGLAVAAVRSATQMDSLKRGLTAVAGSAAEADHQLGRLREIAKLPGLGRVEAIEASIQLQAAGLSAELAERSLLAFGNALATVGKGKAELAGVTTALTQITAKGKVTAEEINQIAERVPQIRVAMQAAFGTANTEALQKMGLTARQFIEGINAELLKLPRVTGGAQVAFENLGDVVGEALGEIGNNILPTLLPLVERTTKALVNLTAQFAALSPEARRTTLAVTGLAALAGPTILFLGQFTAAVRNLGLALPAVLAALRTAVAFLGGPWGIALAAAAAAVVANWDTISQTISDWSAEVVPLLQGTWQNIQTDVAPAMATLKETILGTFRDIRADLKPLLERVGGAISGFLKTIQPGLQKIAPAPGSGLAGWLLGHVKKAKGELVDLQVVYQEFSKDIAAPMGTATRAERPDRREPGKRKLTDADRQELSLMRELRGETARLLMIRAGEDKVTQQLADRYSLLTPKRREELAVVLRQVEAAERQSQALEAFRKNLQGVYAETRAARGDRTAMLRQQNPDWSAAQIEKTLQAEAARERARNDREANQEAEQQRKARLRNLKQERSGRLLELTALMPERALADPRAAADIADFAEKGFKLQDVLDIVAFAARDLKQEFFALSDAEQKIVEDNYWYEKSNKTLADSLERFKTAAERKIELHREAETRLERERTATLELSEAMKRMNQAIRDRGLAEKENRLIEGAGVLARGGRIGPDGLPVELSGAEVARDRLLEQFATGTEQVFSNVFTSLENGFQGFFGNIYQGFKQMLVRMAADYLSSELAKAFLGFLGNAMGFNFPVSGRQHGGAVTAGRPYLVGERGPELIVPRRSGSVVPNGQMAGAGGGGNYNITVNFNGPANQFDRRNVQAAMSDALQQAERARRRSG